MSDIYYFAYGHNLDSAAMAEWCPGARVVGVGRSRGFRIDFRRRSIRWKAGVADIVVDPGGVVWGLLYEVPESSLAALDRKEGVGIGAYERVTVLIEGGDGGAPVEAIAYTVVEKSAEPVAPSEEYARVLMSAATRAVLPAGYLEELGAMMASLGVDPATSR